jgi:hypothetical protein
VRGPVTALPGNGKEVGGGREAVVRMPREKAAAGAGRSAGDAAKTRARSATRRVARFGVAGGGCCGREKPRRGEAEAAVVLPRRRGGLAGGGPGGAASEWVARIGPLVVWGVMGCGGSSSPPRGPPNSTMDASIPSRTPHPVLPRKVTYSPQYVFKKRYG